MAPVPRHGWKPGLLPDEARPAAALLALVAFQCIPLPPGITDLLAPRTASVRADAVLGQAASAAGVLVTHAEAGFVKSVVELTLGFLVDLSRGMSRATAAYQEGRVPEIRVGRQLAGSTAGIIGYGRIARDLGPLLATMGMTVLVSDPYAQIDDRRLVKLPMEELLARSDYVICLAIANEETENLLDAAAFVPTSPLDLSEVPADFTVLSFYKLFGNGATAGPSTSIPG